MKLRGIRKVKVRKTAYLGNKGLYLNGKVIAYGNPRLFKYVDSQPTTIDQHVDVGNYAFYDVLLYNKEEYDIDLTGLKKLDDELGLVNIDKLRF